MTTFQLDQNSDNRRFVEYCRQEQGSHILRYPRRLKDTLDPVMLEDLMSKEAPLVTFDRAIAREHAKSIPHDHPGIIIVSNPNSPQTMTVAAARRIMANFKFSCTTWKAINWQNSIVEITEDAITVSRITNGNLLEVEYVRYSDENWEAVLGQALATNVTGNHNEQ